jgi:hypothetical protein
MIQGPIDILIADSGVQSAVGRNTAATKYKVYWAIAPDTEQPPYVVLQIVGNTPTGHKDDPSSLDQVQFAALSYALSPEEVDEVDIAVRAALEVQRVTSGGYYFHRIYFNTQQDGYDSNAKLPYRGSIYTAMVQRTIPT